MDHGKYLQKSQPYSAQRLITSAIASIGRLLIRPRSCGMRPKLPETRRNAPGNRLAFGVESRHKPRFAALTPLEDRRDRALHLALRGS